MSPHKINKIALRIYIDNHTFLRVECVAQVIRGKATLTLSS